MRNYLLVTLAYWAFTLTDGALHMLVLLHFHELGYTPVELAFLFLLYEFCGIITNLFGGWLAARTGLRSTLLGGLGLQVVALAMLSLLDPSWARLSSVAYVMAAQALSGVAKDLTKMSSKTAVKFLVPKDDASSLFRWVAVLTGSKNALKGVGFFLGGFLLATLGFRGSLWAMAGGLVAVLAASTLFLPREIGKVKEKVGLRAVFSSNRGVNVLSAARVFLFASRDVWFVVAVPIFLYSTLGWTFTGVGSFLALWVIVYGVVQSAAPGLIRTWTHGHAPQGRSAFWLAALLFLAMSAISAGLAARFPAAPTILSGLLLFCAVFAVNSSVHSYLILAYAEGDKVALRVGFYYMANACGRLLGTLLSGVMFQLGGLDACLATSAVFALAAALIGWFLPRPGGAPA